MLTLKHFEKLLQSYGGDLTRWPEASRREAGYLLQESPEARDLVDEARKLDEAIEAATEREHAKDWPDGEADAALDRLRAQVGQRIRGRTGIESDLRFFPSAVTPGRLAVMAGIAAVAGLLIGSTSFLSAPATDNLLAVLQSEPVHLVE